MIPDENQHQQQNILIMWFDARQAFDSVPHDWIIPALYLAKVPQKINEAIQNPMKFWLTAVHLMSERYYWNWTNRTAR